MFLASWSFLEYLVDLTSSYGFVERFGDHLGAMLGLSWPFCLGALGVLLGSKTAKTRWKIYVWGGVELLGNILEYLGDLTSSYGILEPCLGHFGAILDPFGDMLASFGLGILGGTEQNTSGKCVF